MNIYGLDITETLLFFCGLVRVSAILVVFPIFSSNVVPPLVRILFAFCLSTALFPAIKSTSGVTASEYLNSNLLLVALVMKEALVGVIVGFMAKVIFESISFGFAYMSMQMGFGFSNLYDPNIETSSPVVSNFVMVIVSLLFIAVDGHHLMINAIAETFTVLPLGVASFTKQLSLYVLDVGASVFVIAVRIAAPIAVVIFSINVGFGLIARAIPQVNVLLVSFTVNILVGILVLFLVMPQLGTSVGYFFQLMFEKMNGVLVHLNG